MICLFPLPLEIEGQGAGLCGVWGLPLKLALGGVCSLANYSGAYEESQSNRVSDFSDFVCSLFPKAILFDFYCDCGTPWFFFFLTFVFSLPVLGNTSYSTIVMLDKALHFER